MTINEAIAVLEAPPNADFDAVRRAYLRKVRKSGPESDPAGFRRLREAFECLEPHLKRGWLIPSADPLPEPHGADPESDVEDEESFEPEAPADDVHDDDPPETVIAPIARPIRDHVAIAALFARLDALAQTIGGVDRDELDRLLTEAAERLDPVDTRRLIGTASELFPSECDARWLDRLAEGEADDVAKASLWAIRRGDATRALAFADRVDWTESGSATCELDVLECLVACVAAGRAEDVAQKFSTRLAKERIDDWRSERRPEAVFLHRSLVDLLAIRSIVRDVDLREVAKAVLSGGRNELQANVRFVLRPLSIEKWNAFVEAAPFLCARSNVERRQPQSFLDGFRRWVRGETRPATFSSQPRSAIKSPYFVGVLIALVVFGQCIRSNRKEASYRVIPHPERPPVVARAVPEPRAKPEIDRRAIVVFHCNQTGEYTPCGATCEALRALEASYLAGAGCTLLRERFETFGRAVESDAWCAAAHQRTTREALTRAAHDYFEDRCR